MNKKTLYIITISIITFICIICGTAIHTKKIFNNNSSDYNKTISFSELENFDSISIDGKLIEISIESSSENNDGTIYIYYNKKDLAPKVSVKDSTLIIEQNSSHNFMGINHCNIKISIPDDYKLKKSDIKLNVGTINISNLFSDDLQIKTNVGEIDISNCNFLSFYGKSNIGEIDIQTVNPVEDYELNLETNLGEINVGNDNHSKNYNQKGNSSKSIIAKSNIGEISITSGL